MKRFKDVSFLEQRALWSFFILIVAWLFYLWPVVYSIFQIHKPLWVTLSTYGITLATFYLVYARGDALENTLVASSQLGLFALFLLASIFVFANVSHVLYAEQSAVLLMVPALVLTVFGPAVIKTLLFPLLYLMLIIPLQDDSLQNRSVIVWAAIGLWIAYLRYLKVYKPKFSPIGAGERPLWSFQNARWLIPTGIAFGILMVSPWLGENIRSFYPREHVEIAMRAPFGTAGWTGPLPILNQTWKPVYPNASAILQAKYVLNSVDNQEDVYLYSAYFDSNRSFAEVLNPKNAIFDPSLWKKLDFKTVQVEVGKSNIITVFEVELGIGAVSRLVWYWYYVAGVSTTDLNVANLLDNVRIIAKYAQGSGVIAVSTPYEVSSAEARKRLETFLKGMYFSLDVLKRPEITYTR